MLIAVTGATGFLGRYIVRQLAGQGHRLRCWYGPRSDRTGFEALAGSVDWLPGRLGDAQATDDLCRGADAVVHAALYRPTGSFRGGQSDLANYLDLNLMGSLRLMQTARQARVGRFVFISTCAVHEIILPDRPLDEAHPLWPTRHYGDYKAAVEKIVHSFGLGEGWPVCSLRPTGIYGLDHPPQQSKWFDLVGEVIAGRPINSPRGGKEVHALDVARAVALLLDADDQAMAGQAFSCYDRYIADQDVARLAKELSGSASTVADVNRGPKNQIRTDKLRALGMTFGGEPLLKQTVAELVAAHRKKK